MALSMIACLTRIYFDSVPIGGEFINSRELSVGMTLLSDGGHVHLKLKLAVTYLYLSVLQWLCFSSESSEPSPCIKVSHAGVSPYEIAGPAARPTAITNNSSECVHTRETAATFPLPKIESSDTSLS